MKVLETFKAKQSKQEVMKSFINFYSKASKVSGKCLVKYSFIVLRYFLKKQAFYKAYTH